MKKPHSIYVRNTVNRMPLSKRGRKIAEALERYFACEEYPTSREEHLRDKAEMLSEELEEQGHHVLSQAQELEQFALLHADEPQPDRSTSDADMVLVWAARMVLHTAPLPEPARENLAEFDQLVYENGWVAHPYGELFALALKLSRLPLEQVDKQSWWGRPTLLSKRFGGGGVEGVFAAIDAWQKNARRYAN